MSGIFFITPQVAGFSGHDYIVTWSMNPNANVIKHTHQIPRTLSPSYFPLGQSIYIFSWGSIGTDASVQCLPLFSHVSNFDATPNSMTTTVIPTRYSSASNGRELRNMYSGAMTWHESHRDDIKLWAVGHSETYVLLLVDAASSSDGAAYLGLLHFSSAEVPPITFRKLGIGDTATRLESMSRIAIDDALGTIDISILDGEGNMSIISYA
ncbi:hypothetical protein B0H16DRAFT_1748861 [Mycena metata]|uniref:Uncharacterized protein n=1 Tax=Mycena metata TaxID=1033252 RepID=A0AAD7GLS2_9AGAR|nr:hypothetical protein B0H16DRAFT_1748861 [Mycena metata]